MTAESEIRLRQLQEAVTSATARVNRYAERLDTREFPGNWTRLLNAIRALREACAQADRKRIPGTLNAVFLLADPQDSDVCSADLREEQRLLNQERRRLTRLNEVLIQERVSAQIQQANSEQDKTGQQESIPFDRPAVSNDPTQPGCLMIDVLGLPTDRTYWKPLRDPLTNIARNPQSIIVPTKPTQDKRDTNG